MRTILSLLAALAIVALPAIAAAQSTTVQMPPQAQPQVLRLPQQPPMTFQQLQQQSQQALLQAQQAQQAAAWPYQPTFQQSWPRLNQNTGWPQTHPWSSQTNWSQTGWGSDVTVQPPPQPPQQ